MRERTCTRSNTRVSTTLWRATALRCSTSSRQRTSGRETERSRSGCRTSSSDNSRRLARPAGARERMADDYDNTDEIANLTDDELRTLVQSQLRAQPAFDADDITVEVRGGHVSVEGRVGTQVELRVVDHVLTDLI